MVKAAACGLAEAVISHIFPVSYRTVGLRVVADNLVMSGADGLRQKNETGEDP